jgi:hypothetical protein
VTERPKVQHWKSEKRGCVLAAENAGNHGFCAVKCTSRLSQTYPYKSPKTALAGCHDNRKKSTADGWKP